MYKDAQKSLEKDFPTEISNKFRFLTFAIDTVKTSEGNIVPGIGGLVYPKLGLGDSNEKNKYTPEIVKRRAGIWFSHEMNNVLPDSFLWDRGVLLWVFTKRKENLYKKGKESQIATLLMYVYALQIIKQISETEKHKCHIKHQYGIYPYSNGYPP